MNSGELAISKWLCTYHWHALSCPTVGFPVVRDTKVKNISTPSLHHNLYLTSQPLPWGHSCCWLKQWKSTCPIHTSSMSLWDDIIQYGASLSGHRACMSILKISSIILIHSSRNGSESVITTVTLTRWQAVNTRSTSLDTRARLTAPTIVIPAAHRHICSFPYLVEDERIWFGHTPWTNQATKGLYRAMEPGKWNCDSDSNHTTLEKLYRPLSGSTLSIVFINTPLLEDLPMKRSFLLLA